MRRTTFGGLGVAVALLLVACGPVIPNGVGPVGSPLSPKQPLMAEFDRNLALWQTSAIDRYAFTYRPMCFCDATPRLVVVDGGAIRIDGGAPDQRNGAPAGVPGLFEIVRRAINGDSATVGYDPVTGVPVAMASDPIKNAIDDELSFSVDGWTLDPPNDRVLGQLTAARRLWDGQRIQDYDWSIRITCKCQDDGRRFDITVRSDEVATVRSGTRQITFDPIDPAEPFSVARLFDIATYGATTVETTVEIDARFGYPTHVEIRDDRPDAVPSWSLRVLSFAIQ